MKKIEDILDHALSLLKNEPSVQKAALSSLPEAKELARLLSIAKQMAEMPKKQVPEPAMQRKYMNVQLKQRVWFAWLHVSKFAAVSMSLLLLLAGVGGTAYGAMQSLPGETLFPVRKTAERMQLQMTSDPVKRANLQVGLAQKRLNDVQKVFQEPQKDPAREIAALQELSSQTKETVESVKSAAANNAITQTNHPLVSSLETLSQEQQTLLSSIQPDQSAGIAASDAKQATQDSAIKITEIKRYIEIASVNRDSNLTDPGQTDGTVTLLGAVTQLGKTKLIVEQTSILIASSTQITDASGTPATLSLNDQVSVSAYKENSTYTAKKIVITTAAEPGTVKGAQISTTTPEKISTSSPQSSTSTKTNEIEIQPETPKAVGTFIPEDPSPQYVP